MLTVKQKRFITILLTSENLTIACRRAKICRKTYYNWLKENEFIEEIKKRQSNMYERGLAKLSKLFDTAVSTYKELLECDNPSVRCRAAKNTIEDIYRLVKYRELDDRMIELEEVVDQHRIKMENELPWKNKSLYGNYKNV